MDDNEFIMGVWLATMAVLLSLIVYRGLSGDFAGFREVSLATSAWCFLSALGLMTLRYWGTIVLYLKNSSAWVHLRYCPKVGQDIDLKEGR